MIALSKPRFFRGTKFIFSVQGIKKLIESEWFNFGRGVEF